MTDAALRMFQISVLNDFSRWASDESGSAAIEYGLVGALIAISFVAGATSLGRGISGTFYEVGFVLYIGGEPPVAAMPAG